MERSEGFFRKESLADFKFGKNPSPSPRVTMTVPAGNPHKPGEKI